MNKIFEKIKKYYDNQLWSSEQIKDAVAKGKITPEEFKEITSETYIPKEDKTAPDFEALIEEVNQRIEFVEDCLIEMSEVLYE